MNSNSRHVKAYYRVVKTLESQNGKVTNMYGIEGFCGGDVISITSLSSDKERIVKLVKRMNECGLELCQLRDVVDDFMYSYNDNRE